MHHICIPILNDVNIAIVFFEVTDNVIDQLVFVIQCGFEMRYGIQFHETIQDHLSSIRSYFSTFLLILQRIIIHESIFFEIMCLIFREKIEMISPALISLNEKCVVRDQFIHLYFSSS